MRTTTLLVLLFVLSISAFSQIKVTGTLFEERSRMPLMGATVSLGINGEKPHLTTTDQEGNFIFPSIKQGAYELHVSFVGFKPYKKTYKSLPVNGKLGSVFLKEESIELNEVVAQGRATRATQKGDTTTYNASAFKTMAGSSTEQLLAKMPGIIVEGGSVKAQGEQVKRILVDGKPFFEGDPTLALRNLPADMVESIEVFDKMSEQAEFAGFDDGNSQRTINVRTRMPDKAKQFGRASVGYGTDDRYQLNGSYNYFKGERRLSVLAMSNNVNQQNFSQEDLSGAMSGGGRRGMRSGSRSQTMIGQLPGITNTTALGFNYSDRWGEKVKVTASYFFNRTKNEENSTLVRNYFDTNPYTRMYEEEYDGENTNLNHRFNLKLDYEINDRNTLQFRPSMSFQDNHSQNQTMGTTYRDGEEQNKSTIFNDSKTNAYNVGGELLYRHRFLKQGRTMSFSFSGNTSKNDGTNYYTSFNEQFREDGLVRDTIRRFKDNNRNSYKLSGSVNYSEMLSKYTIMNVDYRINYSNNNSDQRTYKYAKQEYDLRQLLDTALTNVFKSDYLTQQVGTGVRYTNKENGLSFYATLNLELASLYSDQEFPVLLNTDKKFWSVLPFVRLDYKVNPTNSLRFMLRGSSKEPSINQLQNVINNNNPLMVSGGNPDLGQETGFYSSLNYTLTTTSGKTFFAMLGGTWTNNYIGTETIIADKPLDLGNGIILQEGAQFTRPVNLNGSWGGNALLTYGMPIDWIKSNLNLTASLNYNRLPGKYNLMEQVTNTFGVTPGMVLSSNISDRLDFTVSYHARLNFTENNLDANKENRYINQTANAKLNWEFWKGFTMETNFTYQNYTGMTDGFNQNYYLLNASIGKKFLKSKRLEAKITAYDLLRQNSALSRNVTNTYYEDVRANVLSPYFMATLVYDLRMFKGNSGSGRKRPSDGFDPGANRSMPMGAPVPMH